MYAFMYMTRWRPCDCQTGDQQPDFITLRQQVVSQNEQKRAA